MFETIRKKIKILVCHICCYLLPFPVYADTTIRASAKVLNFNYEEFDVSGDSLNKETGFIPGLSISASKKSTSIINTLSIELYDGQVDYEGATQSGFPLTTLTNETLYRLFYKLNWFPSDTNNSVYTKISWQQWDRDILPSSISSGLFEQYQWWAFEIGFSLALYERNSHFWLLDLGASKISNGTILVNLDVQGFGQPELHLGSGSGISSTLMYRYMLNDKSDLSLSLAYQYWTFGRSNSEVISNGITTITITEPRSESSHTSLSLNYSYHF